MSTLRLRIPLVSRGLARLRLIPNLQDLLVAQGLPLVAQAFVAFFTAAVLGPGGKGMTALAITIAGLGATAFFLSMHVGIVSAHLRDSDGVVLRATSFVALFATAPLLVGMSTGVARIGGTATPRQQAIFLGLAAIVIEAPMLVVMRTLQGLGDSRRYKVGTLLRVTVYASLVIILALGHLNPVDVISAYIAGDAVGLWFATFSLRRFLLKTRTKQLKPVQRGSRSGFIRGIFLPSLQAQMASLSQQAAYRTDLVLLGFLSPLSMVGQYAFATSIAETLWIISEAISLSLYSTTVRLVSEGDELSVRSAFSSAMRAQFETTSMGMVLLAVLSYPLIRIVFPSYMPAYSLILILLPGIVIGGAARLVTSAAIASERQRLVRRCAIISMCLTPVYVPCILIGQATGAAIASDIIYAMTTVLFLRAHRRLPPASMSDRIAPS